MIRALAAMRLAREKGSAAERSFAETNLEAARTKLRLLGILPDQLKEIEAADKPSTYLTVYAPIGGTVIEKSVRVGQYVKKGDMLYRIADLDPIWLFLDVYEYDLAWVRFGQPVDVAVEAYPGEAFRGTVTFIDPFLDDKTRTVKVRVNLKNPDRRLKPAMYVSASVRVRILPDGRPEPTGLEGKYLCPMHPEVVADAPGRCPICAMPLERVPPAAAPAGPAHDHADHKGHEAMMKAAPAGQVLAVRTSAVLNTGRRAIAYRQKGDGAYELVELHIGPRAEGKDDAGRKADYFPVLAGLSVGDRVVVRGGFLLDSQQQIEGMPSLLYPKCQSAASLHAGHGGSPPPKSPPPGEQHKH